MQHHTPVLCLEVLEKLQIQPQGYYIDCTFGRGGHSQAILAQLGPQGHLLALDQDPEAVQAGQHLSKVDQRFNIIHSTFAQLTEHVQAHYGLGCVQGLLLDLGVSSPQLNTPARGFSFMHDGPLDMRMNPAAGYPVAQWLSQASEHQITEVIKNYGEERYARRIAKAIVAARQQQPLETTQQLVQIIVKVYPHSKTAHLHPATRVFQALRIFINRELEQLQQVLPQTLDILAPGGRLVVISFHSLEDRLVKRFMRECARGDAFPIHVPITADQQRPQLHILGKPVFASTDEIARNPRSRSAVLRAAVRCA